MRIKIRVRHRPAPLVLWSDDHFDPPVLAGSDADQISKSPPMVAGAWWAQRRTRQAAGAALAPAPGTAKKADLVPLVEGGECSGLHEILC